MILLRQNSEIYNNDLRAMIMAFYPGIKIVTEMPEGEVPQFTFTADYREDESVFRLNDNEICVNGCYRDKTGFRNRLKSASYKLLCEYTGRVLPWGDLTGVRPTKIAMAALKNGVGFDEAVKNYEDTYHVSSGKAQLATKVAAFEMSVVRDIDKENDYCLYVGIPFCPSRCLYCSFTSYPIGVYAKKAELYVERLCDELKFIADEYKHKRLVSIYIGGGTPTSIDHVLLDRLLSTIDDAFELKGSRGEYLREYTVEAGRPDSITEEKLQVMKSHNVTRISINPQTMNDETLRTIGRAHTSSQTKDAFAMARAAGFDNINMDLIAGLPGENIDSMAHTISEIRKLGPESVTVHSLAIKRAANLRQQLSEYEDTINKDTDAMLDMVGKLAAELGMEPYYLYRQKNISGNLENVGYAKKGLECLYNILIMEEITDIIAAGAGASTKLTYHSENRVERVENCKSVDDYIDRFEEMLNRKRMAFSK